VSDPTQRVLGWDAVRGLCAIVVAFYHLAYWLQVAELPALGTYGVYVFFALSGASLAYNYPAQRLARTGEVLHFLATRWLRLAPLYLLLCALFLVMLALRNGAWTDRLPLRLALNASFAFGLHDPTTWALLIGGWSLGIEFVFYLAYPLFARLLPWRGLAWGFFAALVAAQVVWIASTVGALGWEQGVTAYHQPQAFAAYFFGGAVLGHWRRHTTGVTRVRWVVLATFALLAALLAASRGQPGDELTGVTGLVLCIACLALVHLWSGVRLHGRAARAAMRLGDATYGTYLLHPLLFFGFAWFAVPLLEWQEPSQWPLGARVALLAAVLSAAVLLGAASERHFEQPVRRFGQKWLRRPPRQSDDASMAS
jgi:peptidoglycan/LPS O-acetylase OafA/YrhL